MARPLKEGMDYFPHDVAATGDKKIEALRALYGNDGYAFYFILLEIIYQEPDFELDISDAETRQILARKVGINEEVFQKILSTAIKWNCFDKNEYEKRQVLTSQGIKKRASIVIEKRDKMRLKYRPKGIEVSDAETREETREEMQQSKVKKRKVKESKVKESKDKKIYADFVQMTDDEYTKLVDEHGEINTKQMIAALNNYKAATGRAYKSDYHAILSWVADKITASKNQTRAAPKSKIDKAIDLVAYYEDQERSAVT